MHKNLQTLAVAVGLSMALSAGDAAFAQKPGGILKISFFDNPASMSLHEEATGAALRPMMGVFNNLVMYDQHVAQNSPDSIIPDLATSWSWSEDGKELTFPLREGVRWHDGKPFTAADVKCTWDLLLGKATEKLRVNPRQTWYLNLDRVTTNGDYEVTFHLKRPSRPCCRCWRPGGLRFIPAMCRRAKCAPARSALVRSNSSSSSRTRWSARRKIRNWTSRMSRRET